MKNPVWLEVALNGPWPRSRQPLIPISVDGIIADGIACARAGASIVHVHAYDERTGLQNDDAEIYVRIIEGIREATDVIVYPTIPFAQSADVFSLGAEEIRYSAIDELGRRGLLECAVVDPGSINLASYADLKSGKCGSLYMNPETHVREGLRLAAQYGFTPSYAIYEPGFLRLGAELARHQAGLRTPIYRFMFTDHFTFGYPPAAYALESYLHLLKDEAPEGFWMAAGLGVDIRPLLPAVIERGGHVRVGLEDAPLGSDVANVAWVEAAVAIIDKAGKAVASADEIRDVLNR